MVPVGTMGSFWLGDSSLKTAGELIGCVQSLELGARASSFQVYPAGSFTDTLFVVSILDIVYECHL